MEDLEGVFANLKLNPDNPLNTKDAAKYLKEIDIALKASETTTKWIDELECEYGPSIDDAFYKLLEMWNDRDDFSTSSEEDGCALRYSVVEKIAKRCLRIEMNIRRDEFQAADAIALLKFINQHKAYYAEKENMIGFRYVANCLAIKGQLKEIQKESGPVSASGLKEVLKTLNEYQNFDIPHQVGVLAIKQYFAGNLLKGFCHDFQLKIIRDLVAIDPENLEWQFCMYSVLRFKRTATKSFGAPSQEEITVIVEAMEKRYAVFDARICLGYAFCLAELLKSSEKQFVRIKYGRKVFDRQADILECIRAKVDEVLALDPTSVRSNIDVAKIYSSILPYPHRDTSFAMMCIKRALLFNPNSSKANHRMAALLISTNSSSAALEYLQKAVENDKRNVFATVDLLKVCIADSVMHKTKIKEIFSDPAHKIGKHSTEILLLKAVYSYFNGNIDKSLDILIDAVKKDAKCVDSLEKLHNNFKRFNWGDFNSFSKGIKNTIELKMPFCQSSDRDVLTKILKSLKDPNAYGSHHEQSKPGRGKYNHNDFFNRSYGSHQSGYTGGNKSGGSRPGSRSGFDYEDFFNRSYGSHQSGGSSYDSGYTGGNKSGGSRPGSRGGFDYEDFFNRSYGSHQSGGSSYDSGYKDDNKSGGSKSDSKSVDHYAVLGLSKLATKDDIKKRFYELARQHHPDKNMDLCPEELLKKQEDMKRINVAYRMLTN